jgi:hypothetical protein
MKNPVHKTLARYFAAAFQAYHLGITPALAYKDLGDEDVGEFWYGLAEIVMQEKQRRDEHLLAGLGSE